MINIFIIKHLKILNYQLVINLLLVKNINIITCKESHATDYRFRVKYL